MTMVSNLGGRLVGTPLQPAIERETAADTGADEDAEQRGKSLTHTQTVLGERGHVDVVVHDHRQLQEITQRAADRYVAPVEVRRDPHDSGVLVHGPRHPNTDRGDRIQRHAGRGGGRPRAVSDPGQQFLVAGRAAR